MVFNFRADVNWILDKEKEVHKETERIRRQINAEKKIQVDLRNEIVSLKAQLEERKQGLLAAARLSDQLENSKTNLASLKEEGNFSFYFRFFFHLIE